MNRRSFLSIGIILSFGVAAESVAPADPPRIGFLSPLPESGPVPTGFQQGLRELGYIQGKNILIEWRRADSREESQAAADGFVKTKVDIMVAAGTTAARAAMRATSTIPVVFASIGDPIGSGFADTLARPGRNGTGVSVLATEMYPKRLEVLHQLVPKATRIVYLLNSSNPLTDRLRAETETAANVLSIRLQIVDARTAEELDAALDTMVKSRPEAILVGGDLLFLDYGAKVSAAVRKARIPAVFPYVEYHDHGVLMSYGPSQTEAGRLAAVYVDKILKGAKPADLPIQQITRVELVIDMRLARELGIHMSRELLLRADRVIR